jgi:hypothetical protein
MGRIFRFFFGSRNRTVTTGIGVLIVVAMISPNFIQRIAYGLTQWFLLALATALGAIFSGIGGAARTHSQLIENLVLTIFIIAIIIWMVRGVWRTITGQSPRRRN